VSIPTSDPERQLAWERRHGPRAGIASLLGVLALIASFTIGNVVYRDAPNPSALQSFERLGHPGGIGSLPSLRISYFSYLDAHATLQILSGVIGLLGYIGLAWGAGYLAVATRARRPELPRWAIYLPIVGGVLVGIGGLLLNYGTVHDAHEFLQTHRTVQNAEDAGGRLEGFGQLVSLLGGLVLAVGLFLVALNAMRAGLLTRIWGYLGVAAGVFLILAGGIPLVQMFWLAGLGALFLGFWPGGPPPAWAAGRAIPWPTPQRPPPKAAKPAPAGGPSAAPRKRKKRR
jgi:hypothetical protein